MARNAGEERSRANSQEHGEEQPGGVFPKSTYATVCLLPFLCLQDSQRCFSLGNITPLGPTAVGIVAYYGLEISPTTA